MKRTGLVALLLAAAVPATAQATTGEQIVGFINAQRAASKIPAKIAYNDTAAKACAAHVGYMAQNGALTHTEQAGKPGYTAAGADAAERSVLYAGVPWTSSINPFENAPIHLAQVLAPRIDKLGAYESGGYGCVTTLMSRNRKAPGKKVTYTYPKDKATGWRTFEKAAELPYTPGQRRNIPAGTVTGPYLLVLFDGPGISVSSEAKATSASLLGPKGKNIPVRVADNRTSGMKGYLPTGAYMIPLKPLASHTKYTARISAGIAGTSLRYTHKWSFTTGA